MMEKITPNRIDEIISAEIPDIEIDKDLHDIVSKNMIHGPCGSLNNNSPCMSDGKCTKRYPRDLLAETITGNDGYPLYRRRSTEDGGKSIKLKVLNNTIDVDNRWVVPYSPLLLKTYYAHINVEYCNSVKAIKYICKYVNKGSDMAVFGVENTTASDDEVTQYQLGRYISSNEAVWRILSFSIHGRYPTLVHLAVHFENGQRVYFTSENLRARAMSPPPTTLTEFFTLYALGRLYTAHPNNAECFYLRLLLINVRGPTSFQELQTVNGHVCATFYEACQKLNLLENDAHWDISLADASNTAQPHQIRTLFSIILTTCFPANPKDIWEKYKDYMSEDIFHRIRRINVNPNIQFTSSIYNEALILIEDICLTIANKSLTELGMIAPNKSGNDIFDRDIHRETHFDVNELQTFVRINLPKLVLEQRTAYDTIINAIANNCGLYFLDASGGTGKTFLILIILATIRSQNNIALAIASSGIEATLLGGGRIAHSALKLPLNMQNYKSNQWVSERAILAAKNIDVNLINCSIQNQIPEEETTYKSIDTVVNQDESVHYPIEFLNSLDLPGMPPHILSLKIGSTIILLRNINPPRLCNGTRLSVKKLMNNIIEATILNGKHKGEHVLLPRIPMIPMDTPFQFKRLQFPVRLVFAMTINKAQGQAFQVYGLNLINPCFSHEQLYVGCSRVGKPSNLFVLAPDRKTKNVVYLQALLK
ncbi:ATP-dependent DNA helicase [Trichonephila clavipes]|nr:ATP-dependent DNA helicase [Trichonephila clavipes]